MAPTVEHNLAQRSGPTGVQQQASMKRIVPIALLFACSALTAIAQPGTSREGPLISLYLPRAFPSEKVDLMYSLKGPFGGYGNYVRPEPDHQTIDFVAAVDGKPASQIKIIAFLPGCEIVTLDFALEGTAMWRQLECKPLKSITLRGQILPASFAQGKRAKVEVNYHAYWAHAFFGVADGFVPTIVLTSVEPGEDGTFSVEVPDFQSQANLGQGAYAFLLHEAATGNILAFLKPDNAPSIAIDMTVTESYPSVIKFIADPLN
jgi:hypothetical protein